MRANCRKDTRPEVALRAALHRAGLRFFKDRRISLRDGRKVRPDIVFPRLRVAVFVDGCFWHGCTLHRTIPASNTEFWEAKIEGTRMRDLEQTAWLESAGWSVLHIWEHEPVPHALERIMTALGKFGAPELA
jgi:DNA mismatch endonuclease, patch repair protein